MLGGIAVEYEPIEVNFEGFSDLLRADMKKDLAEYLNEFASENISQRTVHDIVAYNKEDASKRIPYGQALFEEIVALDLLQEDYNRLKRRLHNEGVRYFETPFQEHQLDAILSFDNLSAGYAAAAK